MKYFANFLILIGFAIIVFGILSLASWLDSIKCQIAADGLSVKYEYNIHTGCRLNIDGKLVPLGNYRFNDGIEREIQRMKN